MYQSCACIKKGNISKIGYGVPQISSLSNFSKSLFESIVNGCGLPYSTVFCAIKSVGGAPSLQKVLHYQIQDFFQAADPIPQVLMPALS